MVNIKVVIGTKNGKSHQKELNAEETDALHDLRLGQTVSGDALGFSGYEFLITGGSDKCGFPMRKGIQEARKSIMIGKSVGFSGKKRDKSTQKGLYKRRTVCGERISKIIHQVNLKVMKEGSSPLGEAPAEEASAEAPAESQA